VDAEAGGSRKHALHEDVHAPTERGTFGMSGRLKSIVKYDLYVV